MVLPFGIAGRMIEGMSNDELDLDARTGSVLVHRSPRPAWRTTPSRGGVLYDRGDGTLVNAGPAVERTYASAGSPVDRARMPDRAAAAVAAPVVADLAESMRGAPDIADDDEPARTFHYSNECHGAADVDAIARVLGQHQRSAFINSKTSTYSCDCGKDIFIEGGFDRDGYPNMFERMDDAMVEHQAQQVAALLRG